MSKFSRREFLRTSAAGAIAGPMTLGPEGAGAQEVAWVERKRYARGPDRPDANVRRERRRG